MPTAVLRVVLRHSEPVVGLESATGVAQWFVSQVETLSEDPTWKRDPSDPGARTERLEALARSRRQGQTWSVGAGPSGDVTLRLSIGVTQAAVSRMSARVAIVDAATTFGDVEDVYESVIADRRVRLGFVYLGGAYDRAIFLARGDDHRFIPGIGWRTLLEVPAGREASQLRSLLPDWVNVRNDGARLEVTLGDHPEVDIDEAMAVRDLMLEDGWLPAVGQLP